MKSLSDKRLIVQCTVNGKEANFLLDTGASVGLLNRGERKKYALALGRRYPSTLVGAGGEFSAYYCNTFAYLQGRAITQFLVADISNVVKSIKRETGLEILGIISLRQMKDVGIDIDANDNEITLE